MSNSKIPKIKIGNRLVGENQPVFVIAEAGVNHNGKLSLAIKLIDAARKAGADAVKFQTFNPETLITKTAAKADYQSKNEGKTNETQFDMLKRLMLSRDYHKKLKRYAEGKGLVFLSTPFSVDDAKYLRRLGVAAIKVGSTDTENIPYLAEIAKWNLPIILSTGMSAMKEIKEAVKVIKRAGNKKLVVFQCTTNYPTPFEDANIRAMATMQKELKTHVGFSDHTPGTIASVAAVALGARVIEKHLTLDKNMPGPDHKASLEPNEFAKLVEDIKNIEKALGTGVKKPFSAEKKIARIARKSIVAARDIKKGEKFSMGNLVIMRPGTGLSPKYLYDIVGAAAKIDIKKDTLIRRKHLR